MQKMRPTKLRNISRRETLKACLVPVGVTLGTRWLAGCAGDTQSAAQPVAQTAGSQANTQAGASAGQTAGVSAAAGTTSPAAIGSGGASAGAPAAGSGTQTAAGNAGTTRAGAGGQTQPAGAGAAGQAQAGTNGGTGAAGSGGRAATAGGGAGGASAGAGAQAGNNALAGPGVTWATGGTKSMQGNYPDPFSSGNSGTACVLYPAQTIGPCYAAMPATQGDISDGIGGLPLRLSFLVVRSSGCMPVPNVSIDIWHSGSDGIYSAYATGTICNPGTRDVRTDMFCRGVQVTDANGRADFNTVFPGWYTGRTIHVHFTLRMNGREAVTSQIYFEDALTEEILAQGDYKARGRRDTTNASDFLYTSGGATPAQVLFTTAKRPDGALHAWKVLSIA